MRKSRKSGYFVAASSKGRVYFRRIPVDNYRRIQRALVKYNLGTDVVDLQNADLLRWKRCVKDVLNRGMFWFYGEKQGEQELREALSATASQSVRGVVSTADSIVIGAGTAAPFCLFCGGSRLWDSVIARGTAFAKRSRCFRIIIRPFRLVGGASGGKPHEGN